jgi:hypothetical protein
VRHERLTRFQQDEKQHPFAVKVLYEECDEVSRRPVAPLGVFDRQDHGLNCAQPFEQHQDRFEQARLRLHGWHDLGVRAPTDASSSGRMRAISRALDPSSASTDWSLRATGRRASMIGA